MDSMIDSVLLGDCFEIMKDIPDGSVDMVLSDPPYATTAAKWDIPFSWDEWWREIKRIRKQNAATLIFSTGKFCGDVWASNPREWRYHYVWVKNRSSGYPRANKQPLRIHDLINVFYARQPKYNPQKRAGKPYTKNNCGVDPNPLYNKHVLAPTINTTGDRYPTDVLYYPQERVVGGHNTPKPSDLCEFLIRTYTDAGDLVLDPFCGGGSTPVAAARSGRRYIGIEREPRWVELTTRRLAELADNNNA